jgi:membrane fusion protein, multidrug efflux system
MKKSFWAQILVLVILLLAVVGLALFVVGYQFSQILVMGKMMAKGAFNPPPSAVTTLVTETTQWQPSMDSVGTITAVNGVTISTDLAGIVSQINFDSGKEVHTGDLIIQEDITQELGQLHQAEAQRDLAKVNLKREADLLAKRTVSQQDYDTAESTYRQDEASVEQYKGLIARKTLRARFDGVLGIRQVNLGQYLNPGDAIVTLQSFDPVYVNFTLPQQDLSKLSVGQTVDVSADAYNDEIFSGKITAINSLVDQNTRNVQVQATFSNPNHKLRPGMFVKANVLMDHMNTVVAVPSTAIHYAPYGDSIFTVASEKDKQTGQTEKIVHEKFVKLGVTRGDMVAVISGIKTGEEIVTSGVFRLRNGGKISINNSNQPPQNLHPSPPDT